jgi:hypothetical protein
MSDDEMNIDDGGNFKIFSIHLAQFFSPLPPGGAGVVRKKGRGFQSSGMLIDKRPDP